MKIAINKELSWTSYKAAISMLAVIVKIDAIKITFRLPILYIKIPTTGPVKAHAIAYELNIIPNQA